MLADPQTDLRGLEIVGIALTATVGKVLTLTGRVIVEVPGEDTSAGAPRWRELTHGRQGLGQLPGNLLLEMGCRCEEGQVLSLRGPFKELIIFFLLEAHLLHQAPYLGACHFLHDLNDLME